MSAKQIARRLIPYGLRVEIARLRHVPRRLLQRPGTARTRGLITDFPWEIASCQSPIDRFLGAQDSGLSAAKRSNIAAVCKRLDGLVIGPHEVFSYHYIVGRPSLLRGFRRGLELHDAKPARGVGGGACKVSNQLYLLALLGGMKIVERHRHALDLFPDKQRTVPFGCGATVFYNYADLRFENPLSQPVLLSLTVSGNELRGALHALVDPGWRAEIDETHHRFYRDRLGWMRENRIRRRIVLSSGELLLDEEVAHNRARVLYQPFIALPAAKEA